MTLTRLFKKLTGANRMNRSIELHIRAISYSESWDDKKPGTTTIHTCPFVVRREAVSIVWELEGKRDDLRIGQKISCNLILHDAEERALEETE